jgi:hypothetical protein
MAQVNLPMTLGTAHWDKQKSALQKVAKPPATKLPEELKELSKQHLALDWSDFSGDKLKTEDEVESRLGDLDKAVAGKIKTLLAQAQAVEKAATSFETEAKKDKAFPKEPLTAVAAIIKSAKEYRADVDAAVADARKALEAKAKELHKAAGGGANSALIAKQTKLLKSRLLTAIGTLRKPQPNARPMRFMIVLSKASSGLALGHAVGPAQEKLLKGLMPGEAPYKVMKDMKATVVWEKNALTFVSDKLSGTVLKKVQAWLKKLLKLNLKMRVRKSTGEVEETEGEDIPEDLLKPDADDVSAGVSTEEFAARLTALQPEIKKGLAGASAAQVKTLLASIMALAKAGKHGDADAELDEMEALLQGEEAESDEEEVDESAAEDGANRDAFSKRLAALQPAIKQGLAGASADRIRQLVDGVMKLAKAERYGDADTMLDGLEKLLKGGDTASKPGTPATPNPLWPSTPAWRRSCPRSTPSRPGAMRR